MMFHAPRQYCGPDFIACQKVTALDSAVDMASAAWSFPQKGNPELLDTRLRRHDEESSGKAANLAGSRGQDPGN